MGSVESAIRWWRAKLLTFRYQLEQDYGRKVTPNHEIWPWMVKHSSWITNRYRVRGDGQASYFGV
eukprot:163420-Alexandrium_andersonii.AAC.1